MIIFDKPLSESLDVHIREHCQRQKRVGLLGTAGFLIGSYVGEDIHVAHIAICSLPETADDSGDLRSRLVDSEWICDHSSRMLRLLPGGVDIVGLLWLADKKLSVEPRSVFIKALSTINQRTSAVSSLHCLPPRNYMALVCCETPLGKPQGYIIDSSRKGAEGSQTRVFFASLEWLTVKSSAAFNISMPIKDPKTTINFYKLFCTAIYNWTNNFFDTETALVNGQLRYGSEPLRSKQKKGKSGGSIRIDTFVSAGKDRLSTVTSAVESVCVADLKANISVYAAVSSKATVRDAINAVKQHVIRSLCSRAELHYECTEVVEDEPKDRISFHQLPRLTCVTLPTQTAIIFTDYIFEGDSAKDSQESFKELLSLEVDEDQISDQYERHLTETDLIRFDNLSENAAKLQKSSVSSSSQSVAAAISVASKTMTVSNMVLISIVIALLAIAVYLLVSSVNDKSATK
uniref:Protein odr-4 homolog n=1 Tax=Syphacia muris TaxID=451379 RepID=A0A0N5AKC8_9BILA